MLGQVVVAAISAAATCALVLATVPEPNDRVIEVRVAGRPGPAPAEEPPPRAGRVVWADAGDVWIYDASSSQRRALTTDGDARRDFAPRFRDPGRVTYLSSEGGASDPFLMEIDLADGQARRLRQLSGWVGVYDWAPDGERLAYYRGGGEDTSTALHVIADGQDAARRFDPPLGRGTFVSYDETRLDWSPDGRRLLLVDTALDTSRDETVYVLNSDLTDALPPRLGTWARWSADGRTVYCLCAPPAVTGECTWQAVAVETGLVAPLPIDAAARPSLSPDGRLLAFDDSQDNPGVHVLDLRQPADGPRLLARGALAPVWLGPGRLAVTDTRPCTDGEDSCMAGGHGAMFEPAGTASAVDVATGHRTSLPPIATEHADTDLG